MLSRNPEVFISYSWDNPEHEDWVAALANVLRENGVVTAIDKFETQKGTVNLNRMMIEKIKNSDYIIVVMTEKYAEKANAFQGGVGMETNFLVNMIMNNLDKVIPIMRSKVDRGVAVPFYLQGVHYIDFSNDDVFESKFTEVLHKIYKEDLIEVSPIGKKPNLKPRKVSINRKKESDTLLDELIPSFKKVTDMDKSRFIKDSYSEILANVLSFSEKTKQKNSNFAYEHDIVNNKKSIIRFYIDGTQKYAMKIWLGSLLGSGMENINVSYGNYISDNDDSMNTIIMSKVNQENELELEATISMFVDKTANTPEKIAIEIWKHILNYFI